MWKPQLFYFPQQISTATVFLLCLHASVLIKYSCSRDCFIHIWPHPQDCQSCRVTRMLSTWGFQPVFPWDVGNKLDRQMQELPAPVPAFPGCSPSRSHPTIQLACLYQVSHLLLWKEINLENIEQILRTCNYGEHFLNAWMHARGMQTGKEVCKDLNRYSNVLC